MNMMNIINDNTSNQHNSLSDNENWYMKVTLKYRSCQVANFLYIDLRPGRAVKIGNAPV